MASELRVLVTGAAGQIAYSLLYSIAKGDVFGSTTRVTLVLLDIPMMEGVLNGVLMELTDCAFPLLTKVVGTVDYKVAFSDIDCAILVGAMPRRQGMERSDLLQANAGIFKGQGEALEQYAKKSVKVLVVGNPANTNCLIASKFAPSIPKENFSCLTRLDQNRAQAQIADRVGVPCDAVSNVIIWGNHSSTQYPDIRHSLVHTADGKVVKVPEAVKDDAWLNGDFIKTVQTRGAAVIAARKLSSALSAAKAIGDHVRDLWLGTSSEASGDGNPLWASMGVYSNGKHYGIPDGIFYSFPVTIKNREWTIVDNLGIDDASRSRMDLTAKELVSEREEALMKFQAK